MVKRFCAEEALRKLWNIPLVESEDENLRENNSTDEESTNEEDAINENSSIGDDHSDQGSGDHEESGGSEEEDEGDENNITDTNGHSEEEDTNVIGDVEWKKLKTGGNNQFIRGRTPAANVFKEAVGTKSASMKKIISELDAFFLFIDESILRYIFNCTKNHATDTNVLQNFSIEVLKKYIGLELARGVYGKNHSVKLLWSKDFGVPIFPKTMSRNRFYEITTHLRFDEKQTRSHRMKDDPFTHIRKVMDDVVANFKKNFVPGFSVCVDEQLMPLKCRCKFIVFMPNKPDKFGMKFWLLVDNDTKYVYNVLPYLGIIEKDARQGQRLSDYVVKQLVEPLKKKHIISPVTIFSRALTSHTPC